jgi:DNA-binding NtrC family response regulator
LQFRASDILEAAGYQVLTAFNADAALTLLTERTDICVIFTDIDMPGSINGLKLALTVRDRWPPIEVIVTSGHIAVHDSDLPSRGVFFSKPYAASELVGTVGRLTS